MSHGGKLAARALKNAGVECIFTLSGGHIMPIYDGCLDEGIRNIVQGLIVIAAVGGMARRELRGG